MGCSRVVSVRPRLDSAEAVGVAADSLRAGIGAIQSELDVSAAFPPEVEAAAAAAARNPRLPELDRTDLALVTIDPPGSFDLDQALHLARDGDGYVLSYAIADLAAFITPGDAVDVEANLRGQTLYGADSRVPLHPTVLSEDAASLLPDQVRPALLWTLHLDADGSRTDVEVERALVRSRARLTYQEAQQAIDAGTADESLMLLKEVGQLRLLREADRGGVSLPTLEQEVHIAEDRWTLHFREPLPVEAWNAQMSLLTGFAAASLMVYARIGVLRTLPDPDHRDVQRLHRTARALGIEWPAELLYPDLIRTLDPSHPAEAALIVASTRLLRGSGYVAFDGETPAEPRHAGLAEEYAHVTAPLRRLVDRYAAEVCVALCAGEEVPGWVRASFADLPGVMQRTGQLAGRYERMILDLVEAGVLHSRVGETFEAMVVSVNDGEPTRGSITIREPAIEAPLTSPSPLPLGTEAQVRLTTASIEDRRVEFTLQ
ncbi:RNB domain-containing ribonuclease [Nocardioides sp.]|uniref:RNB domain-containing ribonuclease n=1 Tax=Nocardioides sp. TaxID=35761 RepID=UPI003567155E